MNSKKITRGAIVVALYVILTNLVPGLSYGPIQFRFSEAMTLLAFLDPFYIWPLTLGVFISNIWSPMGIVDMIFGTAHTFIAVYLMTKTDNIYLASIFPALFSWIIGLEIFLFSPEPLNVFLITGQIMLSEFIIVTIIGVPLFKLLMKNKNLIENISLEHKNYPKG